MAPVTAQQEDGCGGREGGGVDTVSKQLPPRTQRTAQCSLFLLLSEVGRLGGSGGQVALCLPGNHSPSSKINCLTWQFLLCPLSPLRVLPADFNPRAYGPAEPEKLGFLQWADYKAFCQKCLGQAGMDRAGEGL